MQHGFIASIARPPAIYRVETFKRYYQESHVLPTERSEIDKRHSTILRH